MKDLLSRVEDEGRLLPYVSEKDAAEVLDDVASSNYNGTAKKLWSRLEARFCIEVKLHALQDRFSGLKLSERQKFVATFGGRFRSAFFALQTPVADEMLLNRLKAGLPVRLHDEVTLATGDFDIVLSVVLRLPSVQ